MPRLTIYRLLQCKYFTICHVDDICIKSSFTEIIEQIRNTFSARAPEYGLIISAEKDITPHTTLLLFFRDDKVIWE